MKKNKQNLKLIERNMGSQRKKKKGSLMIHSVHYQAFPQGRGVKGLSGRSELFRRN